MKFIFLFLSALLFGKLVYGQDTIDKDKLLMYYQSQQYAEAAAYLKSVYPPDTKDVKALGQMAYCWMMAKRFPEAESAYLKINELQPNTVPVLFSLATINVRRGNRTNAKLYLENIIKVDSNNFNAYKQLAEFSDSVELKFNYLKKANALNLTDADVAMDLALAYRKRKSSSKAYETLKVAIAADTGNFTLLQAQLPVANELKRYNEVVIVGEKLLKNNVDANVLKDVGKAYFFLKNYEKCIALYQQLEKMLMQNESTLYFTSISYRELKNYDMAIKYAKKTIDEAISPNTASYYALLGAIYELNSQFKNSKSAYQRGLTFNEDSNIYYRLALLYDLKLKQKQGAITNYNLYLKSKPDPKKDGAEIEYTKSRLAQLKNKKQL